MAEQQTVRTVLKFLLEGGDIPADVSKRLEELGRKAQSAQGGLKGTSGSLKELTGVVGQFLGAAAIGAFAKGAVTDFARLERTILATTDQLNRMGQDGSRVMRDVRADLEGLAAGGGPLVSETIPGFQKFLGITQDVGQAMTATRLAADVSERGTVSYGQAMDAVANLIQGRAMGAAMALNLQLRDQAGNLKTNDQLMQEIQATVGGLTDRFQDTTNALDVGAAGWERFKMRAGEGLSVLAKWGGMLLGQLTSVVMDVGDLFGLIVNGALDVARHLGDIFTTAFDLKKLATDPTQWWADLKAAGQQVTDDLADSWDTFTEGVKANHRNLAGDAGKVAGDMAGLVTAAHKKALAEQGEADKKALADREKYDKETAQRIAKTRVDTAEEGSWQQHQAALDMLKLEHEQRVEEAKRLNADLALEDQRYMLERLALVNAFHARWLEIEAEAAIQRAEVEREAFLESLAARRAADDTAREAAADLEAASVDARYAGLMDAQGRYVDELAALDQQRAEMQRDRDLANLEAEWQAKRDVALAEGDVQAQADLNNLQTWEDRKAAILANYEAGTKARDKALRDFKRQQNISMAQDAVNSLRTIFGNSKGVAIAQAIIDTYAGAARALKDYPAPYSYVVAGLVIAAGLKQVAEIRKQSPAEGRGFDDPESDRLAFMGGRKWARDLVEMVGRGFQEGLDLAMRSMQAGPAQYVTVNAAPVAPAAAPAGAGPLVSRTVESGPRTIVQVGVLVADEEGLRQLNRELDRVAERDLNRLVG